MNKFVSIFMFLIFMVGVPNFVRAQETGTAPPGKVLVERPAPGPDPYLGFFAITSAVEPINVLGGEIRLSIPMFNLGVPWLAMTLGLEAGFLKNGVLTGRSDHYTPWDASVESVGWHGAVTLGFRSRHGLLSLGARGGYSPWFSLRNAGLSPNGPVVNVRTDHAGVLGIEVGFGPPVMSLVVSLDLHIGEEARWVVPVLGAGLAF